jgi:hypothetical protein
MDKLEQQRQAAELEKHKKLLAQQKEFKAQAEKSFGSEVDQFKQELELFSVSQQPKNLQKAAQLHKLMERNTNYTKYGLKLPEWTISTSQLFTKSFSFPQIALNDYAAENLKAL